ncbi:MAG: MurR/RpiR family transcriptional regulator [Lactococcus sp.]
MKKISDTETYTWDFLEKNMAKVQLSSITELAELAHVSTATIVRTLKKKGFDGFPDYKNSLKRANHDSLIRVAGLSDEANAFVYRNLEEVVRTIGFLNTDSLSDMVEAIDKARQIVIVARDAGEDIGDDLMHRLQSIGKNVITRYYDNMEEYAGKMQADDVMIALSFTGQERIIIEAAKKAKRKNATVLALICDFPSELAKISNSYLLGYKSKLEKEIVAADEESSMPLELLCRILLDMYIIYKEKGSIRATK